MKNILKRYLLIPLAFLVGELSFGLVSKHIMKSEPYLMVQKSIDNFMFNKTLHSFKSSKTSYKANENISFNIKLNKKSRLIADFLVAGAGFEPTSASGGYEPYALYF